MATALNIPQGSFPTTVQQHMYSVVGRAAMKLVIATDVFIYMPSASAGTLTHFKDALHLILHKEQKNQMRKQKGRDPNVDAYLGETFLSQGLGAVVLAAREMGVHVFVNNIHVWSDFATHWRTLVIKSNMYRKKALTTIMMSRKMARKEATKALVAAGLLRTSSSQTSEQSPSVQVPVQTLRLGQQQQQEALELPKNKMLEMRQVEDFIGYTFQEKLYLYTALYSYNNPIGSFIFHRQEWLGDALVEILAADYWSQQAPEQFTNNNFRQSLTNRFLGFLTIILGRHFHGSIWNGRLENARQQLSHRLDLNDLPEDQRNVCMSLPPLTDRLGNIPLHELALYLWRRALIDQEYGQEPLWQQTIIPKSAGDFFESMMGAVFLDSDLSYEVAKKVFVQTAQVVLDIYFSPQEYVEPLSSLRAAMEGIGCTQWTILGTKWMDTMEENENDQEGGSYMKNILKEPPTKRIRLECSASNASDVRGSADAWSHCFTVHNSPTTTARVITTTAATVKGTRVGGKHRQDPVRHTYCVSVHGHAISIATEVVEEEAWDIAVQRAISAVDLYPHLVMVHCTCVAPSPD